MMETFLKQSSKRAKMDSSELHRRQVPVGEEDE